MIDVFINTVDDGINASADNKSVITINDGKIPVKISNEAEEGDGIDSNGSIIINGGIIYAFACPGSDNGLDSHNGITINGGTILSTGDMAEELKSSNNTQIIQMSFSKQIEAGETILIMLITLLVITVSIYILNTKIRVFDLPFPCCILLTIVFQEFLLAIFIIVRIATNIYCICFINYFFEIFPFIIL